MITIVGRKEGDWFQRGDLLKFPCKDLKTIDRLWVQASEGRYGFSVQKEIYVRCGAKLDGEYPGNEIWRKFCTEVGWRVNNQRPNYNDLTLGHLPRWWSKLERWEGEGGVFVGWSLLSHQYLGAVGDTYLVVQERSEPPQGFSTPMSSPSNQTFNLPNNGGQLELIAVPGGTLVMEEGHRVQLQPFLMGKYPITQRQYQAIMGKNPSWFKGNLDHPVEQVNWHEAIEFCKQLSQILKQTIDLPSETQWEWAARGAIKSKGFEYAGSNNLDEVGWYFDNSTHPVGQKKPNELGLYDMSGNVWEWCKNNWTDDVKELPTDGSPFTEGDSKYRLLRGGSWIADLEACRSASRNLGDPDVCYFDDGCRVACRASMAQ